MAKAEKRISGQEDKRVNNSGSEEEQYPGVIMFMETTGSTRIDWVQDEDGNWKKIKSYVPVVHSVHGYKPPLDFD